MRWTVAEVAAVVGGTFDGDDALISTVTQDSREIEPPSGPDGGTLFVPLIAERDGHDFIPLAIAAGAVATLTSRALADQQIAVVRVNETQRALRALGAEARRRLGEADVVGITGSVGKTTTKDLLAAVLSADRPTHANTRSFNNEIGVPLTLLAAAEDTQAVIVEMGARGIGHIADLCSIAQPTVGVVTSVGVAHTSEFGSVEAVAAGKGELVEALPAAADGGVAVLNSRVPLVAAMAGRTDARVVLYGERGEVRSEHVTLDEDLVPSFRLSSPQGSAEVRLGARGLHLIDNALAAAAAALALEVPLDTVAAALGSPILSPMRMSLRRTAAGARVLDDTYNANPLSVEAALRSLSHLPADRRVAILGVMAELGDSSITEHQRMAQMAAELGIDVIAVDASEYGGGVQHADSIDAALEAVGDLIESDAVLVKGSRVAALERLVARLCP